ncbi:HvfX family Cu-binding RiPP maturation protein [Wenzhouxiangella sp. EGI_FJ10305]|uniref:HvfX family Cu-binding RiPP maturation protein n=1 Tax=Wenzhouxiangella sp. EGI_FJ10305 TaxID=3243768 RepID=UPI0035D82377
MLTSILQSIRNRLDGAGLWLAPLGLRLLLAYEFFSAGQQKLGAGLGEAPGWFANQNFPIPFGLLPADMNWMLVTLGELVAGLALLFGLFTRFFAFVLLIITTVAIAAVHWPESWASLGQLWEGYSVSRVMDDGEFRGNFRIPLLFLAMLLPLLFSGPGKLSLDHLIVHLTGNQKLQETTTDTTAFALAALIFAVITFWLIPTWGIVLTLVAIALFIRARMSSQPDSNGKDG